MMLTASWYMLTMTKTHTKTNTKTKTKKRENFQVVREGIVTLCCNISIYILYMRFVLQRQRHRQRQIQRQRQRQDGIHQSFAQFTMSCQYLI